MRSVTADNITDVFTGYFGEDTDPRVCDDLVMRYEPQPAGSFPACPARSVRPAAASIST